MEKLAKAVYQNIEGLAEWTLADYEWTILHGKLIFKLPEFCGPLRIPVDGTRGWTVVDLNPETITLQPSINIGNEEWHGWLLGGYWYKI